VDVSDLELTDERWERIAHLLPRRNPTRVARITTTA
jgi:hypothetical protein